MFIAANLDSIILMDIPLNFSVKCVIMPCNSGEPQNGTTTSKLNLVANFAKSDVETRVSLIRFVAVFNSSSEAMESCCERSKDVIH
jgi:hypothetical protein